MSNTIELPIRKVLKNDGAYIVIEYQGTEEGWKTLTKHYTHSTSAFAALGRLTQKDTLKQQ